MLVSMVLQRGSWVAFICCMNVRSVSVGKDHNKGSLPPLLGFPDGASGKEPACQCRRHEMWVRSLGPEDPLEMGMATHSSIFAWEISWTEEPGRLQPIVLQSRTQLKWLSTYTRKESITPSGKTSFRMFLLGSPFRGSVSFSSIAFEILLSYFALIL